MRPVLTWRIYSARLRLAELPSEGGGTPRCPRRLLETPAGPPSQASTGEQARPPHARTAGAPAMRPNFGAEWAGSDTRCLRFARWVAPQDARLASGCWPDSAGWALCPTGLLRKVSSMRLTSLSPFPRLTLTQARVGLIGSARKPKGPARSGPTRECCKLRDQRSSLSYPTHCFPANLELMLIRHALKLATFDRHADAACAGRCVRRAEDRDTNSTRCF
jgi:hypothetical protein